MKKILKIFTYICFNLTFVFTQCVMCKAVIEQQSEETEAKGLGINTGILFLVLIVYLFWVLAFGKKIKKLIRELLHFYD